MKITTFKATRTYEYKSFIEEYPEYDIGSWKLFKLKYHLTNNQVFYVTQNKSSTRYTECKYPHNRSIKLLKKKWIDENLCDKFSSDSLKNMHTCFETFATKISGIYLILLGSANELKSEIKNTDLNEDDMIYKYGRSDDFARRLKQHSNGFGKNIKPIKFALVDPQLVSQAEAELKTTLQDFGKKVLFGDQTEVVALQYKNLKLIDNIFENIQLKYQGYSVELISQVKEFKHILEINKLQYQLLEGKYQLLEQENHHLDKIYKIQLDNEKLKQLMNNNKILY